MAEHSSEGKKSIKEDPDHRSRPEEDFEAPQPVGGMRSLTDLMQERRANTADVVRRLGVMRKASGAASQPSGVPQTSGAPLSSEVRKQMEPRLGADLSDVRVHTGGEAAKAAAGYGARAFTVGDDVHFGAGQFAPGTKEGDRLLAHELTHVVQGKNAGVQRKKADEGDEAKHGDAADEAKEEKVSDPNEPAEKEADAKGDEVADGIHGAIVKAQWPAGARPHALPLAAAATGCC